MPCVRTQINVRPDATNSSMNIEWWSFVCSSGRIQTRWQIHKLNAIGPTVEVLLSPHMLLLFQEALRVVLWFLLLSLFVFPLENKLHLSPPCTKRCACWQVEQKVSGLSSHPSHLLLFSLLQSFIYLKQILLIPIISWYLNIIFQGQKMPITFSPTWSNIYIYIYTHIYISYGIG